MTAVDYDIYLRLALALALGVMIGLERGWHTRDMAEGQRVAGVRTFSLIGLLGGLLGVAGAAVGHAVVAVGVAGFVLTMAAAYYALANTTEDRGLTTEVAAFITLILGILAVRGDMLLAAIAAVVAVAVLAAKRPVHAWVKAVENAEISAAIKLLLISVVMLPLLPNEGYGPGGLLNPYELWWVVVVLSGVSFAAYAAIRMAGPGAGIFLMGVLGGLASSTAVTLNGARLAVKAPALAGMLSGGIAVACAVMFVRGFVLVFVLNRAAAVLLAWPLLAAAAAAFVTGIVLLRRKAPRAGGAKLDLGPPADILTAIKFGAVLVAVGFAVHYGRAWFGAGGSIAAAAMAGLVDIDAATVTVSRLGSSGGGDGAGGISSGEVVLAVLAAVTVNTFAKFGYALAIAGRTLLRPLALALGAPLAAGAAAGILSFAVR